MKSADVIRLIQRYAGYPLTLYDCRGHCAWCGLQLDTSDGDGLTPCACGNVNEVTIKNVRNKGPIAYVEPRFWDRSPMHGYSLENMGVLDEDIDAVGWYRAHVQLEPERAPGRDPGWA